MNLRMPARDVGMDYMKFRRVQALTTTIEANTWEDMKEGIKRCFARHDG
jgi:hypothetical protein